MIMEKKKKKKRQEGEKGLESKCRKGAVGS